MTMILVYIIMHRLIKPPTVMMHTLCWLLA